MFAFPLLKPITNARQVTGHAGAHAAAPNQPVNTASFKPFGDAYRGGVSLATGWLAGSLGGAERIVVSQLVGRRHGEGVLQRLALWTTVLRSTFIARTSMATAPTFREIASFNPFDGASGTRVATTSTTTGAHLLVSGVAAGRSASVVKYESRRGRTPRRRRCKHGVSEKSFRRQVRSRPYSAAIRRRQAAYPV